MLTLVLIVLSAAVIGIAVVLGVVALQEAFRGEQQLGMEIQESWRPPFVHGEALRQWAANQAEAATRVELARNQPSDVAARLATVLEQPPIARCCRWPDPRSSNESFLVQVRGQGLIWVTMPEAINIAANLRRLKSERELKRIQAIARANADRIASQNRGNQDSPPPCPLQGSSHICCVYSARPLDCRPLHAVAVAGEMGSRSVHAHEAREHRNPDASHEQTVAQGMGIGFARALKSAGLDDGVYELNSALATLLAMSDTADRWARGETIAGLISRDDFKPVVPKDGWRAMD